MVFNITQVPIYQVGYNTIREDYDPFVILLCINSIAICKYYSTPLAYSN